MEKYEFIPEQLLHEGTIEHENFFTPQRLSEEQITLTHTNDYWQKLKSQSLTRKEARPIGFPMTDKLVDRGRFIAHGTIECCRYAMEHGVSMNIAGGTHHAYADHGEGFCVFNDFAIAANYLLRKEEVKQILIVDLDVHQGNGNAHIFQDRPEVFTFSMHGAKNYPLRKEKSDLDIGLPDGCDDDLYLRLLKEALPALIDRTEPDLILYQSGVDVLESDKLGRLSLTRSGCKERDRYVLQSAKENNIPVAISMGGGYSPDIKTIVDAHANTFRLAQEIFF